MPRCKDCGAELTFLKIEGDYNIYECLKCKKKPKKRGKT